MCLVLLVFAAPYRVAGVPGEEIKDELTLRMTLCECGTLEMYMDFLFMVFCYASNSCD